MSAKVDIKHVTIVGGGLMGSGIAQVSFQPAVIACTLNPLGEWWTLEHMINAFIYVDISYV